ncbi:MAG: sialidase family protein [Vicinamibacterales bacterium]
MRVAIAVSVSAALLTAGRAPAVLQPERIPFDLKITPLSTPAARDSGQPQLSVSPRGLLLSWIEKAGATSALRYAERTKAGWTAPRTAASGSDWFVNWADVPSVIRLANGTLVAHWLQKSGADTYAYDVRLTRSTDDGVTWSPAFLPHSDKTKTEHGFASLFQMPGAGLGLVWLDGRAMTGGHEGHGGGDMSLRFGAFDRDWKQTAEMPLDLRVCECCPTAVAVTADGPIVAYRDRSPDEVRDIYIARMEKGKWTVGTPIHKDDWRINACPVNGPSLSAQGRTVAVGWFTARDDRPNAFIAFSADAGRTFGPPVRLDDAASLGRVDAELLPDGSAIAAYIEFASQRAEFRLRRVTRDGGRSAPVTISNVAGNRSSGYPRMAVDRGEVVFAWVDREGGSQVKTAVATLPPFSGGH